MPCFAVDRGVPDAHDRRRPKRLCRPRGNACIDGDPNHRDAAGVRGPPQAEQERPRTRVPGKAFDVQPASVRFQLAGCGERRHVAQYPVAESVHRFSAQVTVGRVANAHQSVADLLWR